MTFWDILIATIPHRHEKLCGLLAELDRQWQPGVGALVYRDNLEHIVGAKRQALLESSRADYVSFVDDDDEVAPDYVARIVAAILRSSPDYVGFTVKLTCDGELVQPALHSLKCGGWFWDQYVLLRDFSHLNPIRRQLALLARFDGEVGEDRRWADVMRARNRVRTEEWLGVEWAYHYRMLSADGFSAPREPMSADDIKPLPSYPWLVTL